MRTYVRPLLFTFCGLGLIAGCSRSSDTELAQARAEAEAARVELAKARAEGDAAKAALARRSEGSLQNDQGGQAKEKGGPAKQDHFVTSLDIKFVLVSKGTFWMGGGGGKPGDKQVVISKDFYIGVYEVTQKQWQAVMGNNPSGFSRTGVARERVQMFTDADLEQFPVEQVLWDDAQEFIKKLNAREKESGWVYRLPTEAEWEYACRGAATSKEECSFKFYLDRPTNDLSYEQANFGLHPGRPTKVGSYKPNRLGIYDMHGNVWEWCEDLYGRGSDRVIRGGGWDSAGDAGCPAAARGGAGLAPRGGNSDLGFRLARVPSGGK